MIQDDPQEVEQMKQHTVVGAQLLGGSRSSLLSLAQEIASAHHERWDGSGYPYGLKESEIPLNARIVSVADVYDALTSERPYKSAWTPQDAIKEIQRMAGTQFDPEVVKAFVAVIEADQLPSFSQAA